MNAENLKLIPTHTASVFIGKSLQYWFFCYNQTRSWCATSGLQYC